jgi:hypothetical protein
MAAETQHILSNEEAIAMDIPTLVRTVNEIYHVAHAQEKMKHRTFIYLPEVAGFRFHDWLGGEDVVVEFTNNPTNLQDLGYVARMEFASMDVGFIVEWNGGNAYTAKKIYWDTDGRAQVTRAPLVFDEARDQFDIPQVVQKREARQRLKDVLFTPPEHVQHAEGRTPEEIAQEMMARKFIQEGNDVGYLGAEYWLYFSPSWADWW